jgi:porin
MRQAKTKRGLRGRVACAGFAGAVLATSAAAAEGDPAIQLSLAYKVDVAATLSGGLAKRGRVLDNLQVFADVDLDRAVGWTGATAHIQLLNNSGATPNDDVGSLQGVDNIEVSRHRLRLFEAWIEQGFGDQGSVRAGLYDLNSEFYANDSAGLLLAPAFGIGSELAATGPNGPSIFPSTALAVRFRWTPVEHLYAQAAVLNADASVLGDPGGVSTSFKNGVLAIAEAGWTGRGKIAVGTWRYSDPQEDLRTLSPSGDPAQATARGAYLLLERTLKGDDDSVRKTTAFARLGVSDGDTTAFKGGWQAGVLIERVFAGRPDSAFSLGLNQAFLSGKYRDNAWDAGQPLERAESAIEVTYSDRIGRVTIQPDLQYVRNPGADRTVKDALVFIVRLGVEF